ncbi:MAG: hypothetical protein ACJ76H_05420 [Bacteriovoracaceae bacterium]
MKFLILLLLCISCTQKYADYDLIRKVDFNKESFERPITVYEVLPSGNDKLDSCFNQWLFFSNAEKEKNEAIPVMVRTLCPGKDYLLNTSMTETWWTTLIFTRSCVEMDTSCAVPKKRN